MFSIQPPDEGFVTVEPADHKAVSKERTGLKTCALDKLQKFFSDWLSINKEEK
jgi:hypothetical protein